ERRGDRAENRRIRNRAERRGFRNGVRNERRGNRAENRRIRNRAERRGFRAGRRAERRFQGGRGFRNGNFRRWDRRGWRNDRRFGWRNFRRANRGLFRLGRYYAPFRGHFYRPLRIGFFLDSLFFQPRFFINDPWAFRLPPVYGPYRWVRYYDDVLLVDVYTGEVVDVIQNFFW
ncbi:MAG: RcnB family protein, partial [Pseudomonadota bacterium]